MNKILLINANTETVPYPVPPVALCLLASSLGRDIPDQLMTVFGADYGVIGPGEVTFKSLINTLVKGGDPREIPGVLSAEKTFESAPETWRSTDMYETPFCRF
ncbi:MAG: hypothetical protein GY847_29870 [Proteobacteria bacterium]|nr:hypothetical protein [Pseudomonadota bacterium]